MAEQFLWLVGNTYLALCAIVIVAALWIPKSLRLKAVVTVLVAGVMSVPIWMAHQQRQEAKHRRALAKVETDRAMQRMDELCKTAGAKIYRTVDNVEGILLLKVRPKMSWKDHTDPMYPGAAMAGESAGESYIRSFLGVEKLEGENEVGWRGTILIDVDSKLPHYRYVDVMDAATGERQRYVAADSPEESMGMNGKPIVIHHPHIKRITATGPMPRFSVDYEDIINPEDRAMWIASTKVRVLDRSSNEVLGEYTQHVMDGGRGNDANGTREPWGHAAYSSLKCPKGGGSVDVRTRYFVDQVIRPKDGDK